MHEEFDVAIVGASVAGSALASHLGHRGLRVALVDQARFPRRKACGEGISEIALEALSRVIPGESLAELPGMPFYAYRIDLDGRSWEFASAGERRLRGMGIERYELDRLLFDTARRFGNVAAFPGSEVTAIERKRDGSTLHFAERPTLSARRIVLADGANSRSARRLGIPKRPSGSPLWGISYLLEGSFEKRSGEVLVLLKEGFEINCTPVSDRRLNIAFLVERDRVRDLQDEARRRDLLDEAASKARFRGTPVGPPLQVGPVGSTKRPYHHDGVLLVGDAAESLDPIAGMGITHAVLVSELAAEALHSELVLGLPREVAMRRFAARAEEISRPYRGFTQLTSSLLRHRFRKQLVPALSCVSLPGRIRNSLSLHACGEPAASTLPLLFLSLIGA